MGYQRALGPLATPWRGPLRFVAQVESDRIIDLEVGNGFAGRACAARLARRDLRLSSELASRVCGLHGHHHLLAWTTALETLAEIEVPPRARYLRLLAAEGERVASHVSTAITILQAIGLQLGAESLVELRATALMGMQTLTGQRLVHDWLLPGGVRHDLHRDEVKRLHALLETQSRDLRQVIEALLRSRGLSWRLSGIGVAGDALLSPLGIGGPIARAAGASNDLRRDAPYAGYGEWPPRAVLQQAGDTYSRLFTLLLESYESVVLAGEILADLPDGRWRGDPLEALPEGSVTSAVEAPSGPLRYSITSDGVAIREVVIEGSAPAQRLVARAVLVGQSVEDMDAILCSLNHCPLCAEA
ncbi:MAG: hypothetical protein NVS4B8_21850 [Herpetosiphon sp.]